MRARPCCPEKTSEDALPGAGGGCACTFTTFAIVPMAGVTDAASARWRAMRELIAGIREPIAELPSYGYRRACAGEPPTPSTGRCGSGQSGTGLAGDGPGGSAAAQGAATAPVEPPAWREGAEQALNLGRSQGLRQWCQAPACWRGDDRQQMRDSVTFERTEAKIASHGRRRDAGAGGADASQRCLACSLSATRRWRI